MQRWKALPPLFSTPHLRPHAVASVWCERVSWSLHDLFPDLLSRPLIIRGGTALDAVLLGELLPGDEVTIVKAAHTASSVCIHYHYYCCYY